MPPFGSVPYAGDDSRITDILLRLGDIQARKAEQQGQIWGSTVSGLGQLAGETIQRHGEEKSLAARDRALVQLMGQPDATPQDFARVAGPKLGLETYAAVQAFNKTRAGVSREEAAKLLPIQLKVFKKLTPEARAQLYPSLRENSIKTGLFGEQDVPVSYTADLDPQIDAIASAYDEPAKTREVKVRTPEGGEQVQIVEDKPGQTFSSAPDPALARQQAAFEETRRHNLATEAAARSTGGTTAQEWVVRDGQPMPIPKGTARPGDLPYESAKTAVKRMPAGSAEDLAGMQSGLDQLKDLRTELSTDKGAGVISRVGAAIPGATYLTGWGADTKSRQAVIDRVKQIIGKSLEGGVLRKEDEEKYKRILPSLDDPADVAQGKIDGLEEAISKKRDRQIEALSDAGYDTTRFEARAGQFGGGGGGGANSKDPMGIR